MNFLFLLLLLDFKDIRAIPSHNFKIESILKIHTIALFSMTRLDRLPKVSGFLKTYVNMDPFFL